MQFTPNTMPNFEAIKAAVSDLNSEHKLAIQLRPIRIDEFDAGYSYAINDEILRLREQVKRQIAVFYGLSTNVAPAGNGR
jgi:hypothetical protein